MSNAARKARKQAGEKFVRTAKTPTPKRSRDLTPGQARLADKLGAAMANRLRNTNWKA